MIARGAADRVAGGEIFPIAGANVKLRNRQKWLIAANGDPYENRTRVFAVRGRRPNR